MDIDLKCFAGLAERYKCGYREATRVGLPGERATVQHVLAHSGISPEEVRIVFVNGEVSGPATALQDGDRVALVPATGGM